MKQKTHANDFYTDIETVFILTMDIRHQYPDICFGILNS